MCDDDTVNETDGYISPDHQALQAKFTRRKFNTLTMTAAMASLLPPLASAMAVTERDVEIDTPDGICDAYFVHPSEGKHPAVLVWPDILALRPAFRTMGKRLAQSGYAVLVINPYYRSAKAPVVGLGASFQDQETRDKVIPFYRELSQTTHQTDARAFVGWLDQQVAVDTSKGIGTQGYCMGGPMIMNAAAAVPDRIKAAASFHGGGLATDKESSPHLQIPKMQADFLIAVAENDDARYPEEKNILKTAFADNGLDAEIEVYPGALHGWCVLDSRVYNKEQAERAWSRLLALYERALV
jgi:carboxymethylenebutenolidase